VSLARCEAAFDPDLGSAVVLPVGEEADAVSGAEDPVEIAFQFGKREVLVDGLSDLERRLEVQGDAGDDSDGAEADDCGGELVSISVAGQMEDVTGGGDDFEGANGSGKVAVVQAGAMGCGGDRTGDGDMRERCEIVKGVALSVDDGGELAVADSGADHDGAGMFVNLDRIEIGKGDLVLVAVGDAVEGVARAEGADLCTLFCAFADFVKVSGSVDVIGAVVDVAGPVLVGCGLLSMWLL